MLRHSSILLLVSFSIITALYLAASGDTARYPEKFNKIFDRLAASPDSGNETDEVDSGEDGDILDYRNGDWGRYIYDPAYRDILEGKTREGNYADDRVNINSYGAIKLNFSYGKSYFTDSRYRQYDEDEPQSRVIKQGFLPEQIIQLHIEGNAGNRINVFIDHDSEREDNYYMMQYRAASDDEILREINAGQIDIKFNNSKYAVYDNTDAKAMGVDFTVRKNRFMLKAFGSVTRGQTAVDSFRGNSTSGGTKLAEYQYLGKTYYQLEPFVRYDNLSSMPSGSASYTTLVTFTSAPADPLTYSPYPVNINPEGFELYIDDQNQYNNNNAITLSLDGGYYTRMVNGTDYSINYTTGVIKIIRPVPDTARIFAVYNRTGGTVDPGAITSGAQFPGKIFVFIRYGTSINEDRNGNFALDPGEDANGDGRLNLDVYEIRSFYYLNARQLISGSVSLSFYKENVSMDDAGVASLGRYRIDATNGILSFNTREPFRSLMTGMTAEERKKIYSETKSQNAYQYSRFAIEASYRAEARSFQLSHSNLIENSVRVKINGSELNSSKYSVDYLSGFLVFTDSSNPVIGSETLIEIKYEFLPFGSGSESFVGGLRMDYQLSRDIKFGGSFLIARGAEAETIPDLGNESGQTLLYEGDVTLNLDGKRIADIYNLFTGSGVKSLPFAFSAYGEYDLSLTTINTFGKALIDNMESSDESIVVSLSEKDWVLSSMPSGYGQPGRGLLYYRFYRDPSSPDSLKGETFSYYAIDYGVKPGPYNIATGHINSSITKTGDQRSLVLDYDFAGGTCVSVVTRNFSDTPVDLSGVQYIEITYRLDAAGSVNLYLDMGDVNEDSDGDLLLDREDVNSNGTIDSDPSSGYSEDRGYAFNGNNATVVGSGPGLNSSTKGDGVLNTEDLNGNGTLDTAERVVTRSAGTIAGAAGTWKTVRIPVAPDSSEIEILRSVTSLRLYMTGSGTGRLFIDNLKLVTSKWKNPSLDGVYNTSAIRMTFVSVINDSDYAAASFLRAMPGLYKSLYGGDDDLSDVNETALRVDFDITGGSCVSLTRTFSKTVDIRYYKTLNLWLNARSFNSGSTIGIIIGSSDNDYAEYRFTPAYSNIWEAVTLRLSDDSSGKTGIYQVTGEPDYKRIKYIKVLVYGSTTSGAFWLNEIYVSEPETVTGNAHWYECRLDVKRPFAVTDSGVPVISDMMVRYTYKGNSSGFNSVNKTTRDLSENWSEVYSSFRVLPNWNADISYSSEKSRTDSFNEQVEEGKRGESGRRMFAVNSVFTSTGGMVPSITFSYMLNDADNSRGLEVSNNRYKYDEKTSKTVQAPLVMYRQIFDNFLWGKLVADAGCSMVLTDYSVSRKSGALSESVLSAYVSTGESQKKQKSAGNLKLDYSNSVFFLKPSAEVLSEEVVESRGKEMLEEAGIASGFSGGYHLPFDNRSGMKYLERGRSFSFSGGILWFDYLKPEYSVMFNYRENGFCDYASPMGKFTRSKSANSYLSSDVKIPVYFNKTDLLKIIRNFQVNYSRSMTFNEADVPFEGEGHDSYAEEYGISRVMSGLGSNVFNIFSFYPGCYFSGRGNYGRGRDLVYDTLNTGVGSAVSGPDDYNNSLRLNDRFSASLSAGNEDVNLSLTGSLNQACERSNTYGIPNQVITSACGVSVEFDLMRIFDFWFFRENKEGLPYHASALEIGSDLSRSEMITYNIREVTVSPFIGLTFKVDRSSIVFKGKVDLREREDCIFINPSLGTGSRDYIYISNIEGNNNFREHDEGYSFSVAWETDVRWIYDFFSSFYRLTGTPIFNLAYRLELDRYDYLNSISPEPYDLHFVESALSLDLHKNIRGGLNAKGALEKYRNRETNAVSREVISYEISGSISLIF